MEDANRRDRVARHGAGHPACYRLGGLCRRDELSPEGLEALTLDPVNNWIERAESIPRYLDEAIGAKSRKKYGSACWLVVYRNINEYDIRQRE